MRKCSRRRRVPQILFFFLPSSSLTSSSSFDAIPTTSALSAASLSFARNVTTLAMKWRPNDAKNPLKSLPLSLRAEKCHVGTLPLFEIFCFTPVLCLFVFLPSKNLAPKQEEKKNNSRHNVLCYVWYSLRGPSREHTHKRAASFPAGHRCEIGVCFKHR